MDLTAGRGYSLTFMKKMFIAVVSRYIDFSLDGCIRTADDFDCPARIE
jgi:hypothetical protein